MQHFPNIIFLRDTRLNLFEVMLRYEILNLIYPFNLKCAIFYLTSMMARPLVKLNSNPIRLDKEDSNPSPSIMPTKYIVDVMNNFFNNFTTKKNPYRVLPVRWNIGELERSQLFFSFHFFPKKKDVL